MNGHRVGREERKGPGWKKPGARRAEEKAMQASGNMPLEKPVTCPGCSGIENKDLGSGWFKCRKDGCRRRFFIRSRS